ncbi:Paf1 complex component [Dimargaris cristalligena]|nr:Paf1 complex component [Dimargaris cristalligena]
MSSPPPAADHLDDLFGGSEGEDASDTGTPPPALSRNTSNHQRAAVSESDQDDFDLGAGALGPAASSPSQPQEDAPEDSRLDDLFGEDSLQSPQPATEEYPLDSHDYANAESPLPVRITATPIPFAPHSDHYISKIPGFLHFEPQPFDPDTYEEERMEAYDHPEALKLKLDNTIRWRQVKDPQSSALRPQSNARFVKWSDGSMSLVLGSEFFDVIVKPVDNPYCLLTTLPAQDDIQQGCCQVSHTASFRPSSTTSLTHKKLSKSIADRHRKKTRTKLYNTTKDPELLKRELEVQENERLKAIKRLEATRARKAQRYTTDGLNETSLEAEEYSAAYGDDRTPGGPYGRSQRPSHSAQPGRGRNSGRFYRDDDGFVVDDDDDVDEEGGDGPDYNSDREADRLSDLDDVEARGEQRILEAKQRGMNRYREASPVSSEGEEAEHVTNRRQPKRKTAVWSEDEDDSGAD